MVIGWAGVAAELGRKLVALLTAAVEARPVLAALRGRVGRLSGWLRTSCASHGAGRIGTAITSGRARAMQHYGAAP